jgi:hypothetical protein
MTPLADRMLAYRSSSPAMAASLRFERRFERGFKRRFAEGYKGGGGEAGGGQGKGGKKSGKGCGKGGKRDDSRAWSKDESRDGSSEGAGGGTGGSGSMAEGTGEEGQWGGAAVTVDALAGTFLAQLYGPVELDSRDFFSWETMLFPLMQPVRWGGCGMDETGFGEGGTDGKDASSVLHVSLRRVVGRGKCGEAVAVVAESVDEGGGRGGGEGGGGGGAERPRSAGVVDDTLWYEWHAHCDAGAAEGAAEGVAEGVGGAVLEPIKEVDAVPRVGNTGSESVGEERSPTALRPPWWHNFRGGAQRWELTAAQLPEPSE